MSNPSSTFHTFFPSRLFSLSSNTSAFSRDAEPHKTMPILAGSPEVLPHALENSILLSDATCIHNTRDMRPVSGLHILDFIFLGFIVPIFFIVLESSFSFPFRSSSSESPFVDAAGRSDSTRIGLRT